MAAGAIPARFTTFKDTMKPEHQRIKIAEACGWKPDDRLKDGTYRWDVRRNGDIFGLKPNTYLDSNEFCGSYTCDKRVPDYLTDLNAMHEAEELVKESQAYYETLFQVVLGRELDYDDSCVDLLKVSRATAAQRAEAFLRTLNLWEESC